MRCGGIGGRPDRPCGFPPSLRVKGLTQAMLVGDLLSLRLPQRQRSVTELPMQARLRLIVRELHDHDGTVLADCRGDGAIWTLGRDPSGWFCSCPARGRCTHLYALGLVCALEPREPR